MLDLEDVKRLIPELENNLKARDVQIAEKDAIIRKQESVISEQLGKIQKLQTDLQELQVRFCLIIRKYIYLFTAGFHGRKKPF